LGPAELADRCRDRRHLDLLMGSLGNGLLQFVHLLIDPVYQIVRLICDVSALFENLEVEVFFLQFFVQVNWLPLGSFDPEVVVFAFEVEKVVALHPGRSEVVSLLPGIACENLVGIRVALEQLQQTALLQSVELHLDRLLGILKRLEAVLVERNFLLAHLVRRSLVGALLQQVTGEFVPSHCTVVKG